MSVNLESKDGYTIHLGQTEDLLDKLANLPAIIQRLEEMGLQGGTIDLAVQGDPVYSPPETAAPETDDTRRPSRTTGKERKRPNRPQRPRRVRPRPAIRKLRHSRQPHRGSNFDG